MDNQSRAAVGVYICVFLGLLFFVFILSSPSSATNTSAYADNSQVQARASRLFLLWKNSIGAVLSARFAPDPEYLLPADKQNSIGFYTPDDLVPLPSFPGHYLRKEAAGQFERMIIASRNDGVYINVLSSHRSYGIQEELFSNYAAVYGTEQANTFSAFPGHSEHQLGTTVDLGSGEKTDLTKKFENTNEFAWLVEHAYRYGFVLSYPEEKEDITGYIYEPWHWRYVGEQNARIWKNSDKTVGELIN